MVKYYSEIPTKLDKKNMKTREWIVARTQELYDMLPQTTLEERNTYTNIRDEIISLNYTFFGYIAKIQNVTDPMATYEDKLQVALMSFCQMWSKYKFIPEGYPEYTPELEYKENTTYNIGDYVYHQDKPYKCKEHIECSGKWDNKQWKVIKKYRDDLSFTVFFKPRLQECVRRELNTVKYSLRREVCMKAAAQLGKHWGQLTRDDISKVDLPPQEMETLVAVFYNQYDNPYGEDSSVGVIKAAAESGSNEISSYWLDTIYNENYDEVEDLIVHEMIEQESKLDDAYLLKMSELYGIPFAELKKAQPIGEAKLKKRLEETLDIRESFESDGGYEDRDTED